jgi:hypothetical protein
MGDDTRTVDTEAASVSLEYLAQNISKRRAEYDEAVNAASSKIEEAAAQIQSLRETADQASREFNGKLEQWTTQGENSLANSKKQFSDVIAEIKIRSEKQLQAFFSEQDSKAKIIQEQLETQIETIISDSVDKHTKILELYKLVARDSITGGHKQIADREYKAAETWRWMTIGSIVATALWIAYTLFWISPIVEPEKAFWLQVGKSVSLTALLISFAVYASKQAALYRVNERKARSFFLQVQAFDPFIEGLPDEKRVQLKQELTARIFGSDESEFEKVMIENGGFKDIYRTLDLFEKVKKLVGR